tara:strand:+ start:7470 stop:7844 length:375 start_codon:yes stop_codon:yes gene_type:complete
MLIAISLLFTLIAGAANGIMDLINFHWHRAPEFMQKNYQFWNPEISWKNKWNTETGKEKFLGSSTIFAFLTDGWHLMKTIMLICLIGTPSLLILFNDHLNFIDSLLVFLVLRFTFGLGFYITYG